MIPGHRLAVAVPVVGVGDRTGEGAGGPAALPGQGLAPAGATVPVPGLHLELVPLRTRPRLTARSTRDHGLRPLDAVLRNAPSTPRPSSSSPGDRDRRLGPR